MYKDKYLKYKKKYLNIRGGALDEDNRKIYDEQKAEFLRIRNDYQNSVQFALGRMYTSVMYELYESINRHIDIPEYDSNNNYSVNSLTTILRNNLRQELINTQDYESSYNRYYQMHELDYNQLPIEERSRYSSFLEYLDNKNIFNTPMTFNMPDYYNLNN